MHVIFLDNEGRVNVFGRHAKVSIENGLFQIQLPAVQLDTIAHDVRERIFTKRAEKKITYESVRTDLDSFIETLQLSRSTTPGESRGKFVTHCTSVYILRYYRKFRAFCSRHSSLVVFVCGSGHPREVDD